MMTDHIKHGLLKIVEHVLSEKGLLGLLALGTWALVVAITWQAVPGVISTWRVAQEENTKSIAMFLSLQTKQQEIQVQQQDIQAKQHHSMGQLVLVLEGVQQTLAGVQQTLKEMKTNNEIDRQWRESIGRRLERIEEQTRYNPRIERQTMPAGDERSFHVPTRDEYDRSNLPNP